MNWESIGNVIGGAAPLIGSLLLGKAGEKAGELVAAVLGCDPTPAAVSNALTADPEAFVKLKQAEMDHVEKLQALAFQEKQLIIQAETENRRIDTADFQNARGRDADLKKAGYTNRRADLMVAVAFCSLVFICWLINSNVGLKPEVLAIFNMAIGALLKMLGDAFQFEFGSSRGSKLKDLL